MRENIGLFKAEATSSRRWRVTMFKLKKDVDFKELEKFGFRCDNNNQYVKTLGLSHFEVWKNNRINNVNLYVYFGKECINRWDGTDINKIREIWLGNESRRTCDKEKLRPYIQDLIQAGLVEELEDERK